MPIDAEVDPEREYRARTGKVLRRRGLCSNNKRRGASEDCPHEAIWPAWFCSEKCRGESIQRSNARFVGGSICSLPEAPPNESELETPPTRNPTEQP